MVVTPSLNKSFKFQSNYPNNSSQAYILSSLLNDLKNDEDTTFEEDGDKYIMNCKVNYPNNSNLVSQKLTFNKDMVLEKVEVYNSDRVSYITLNVTSLKFDVKFDNEYFNVESSIDNESSKETSVLDEIIYPMYLPAGTVFKSEETVSEEDKDRVILTFTGDKSFIMIEEVSSIPNDFEVQNSSGDLVFYENILGSLTETSLTWSSNGKDYYIIGDDISSEEMLKVASSTSAVSLVK